MFSNAKLNQLLHEQIQETSEPTPEFNRYIKPENQYVSVENNQLICRKLEEPHQHYHEQLVEEKIELVINNGSENSFCKRQSSYQEVNMQAKQIDQEQKIQIRNQVEEDQGTNEFLLLKNQMFNIQSLAVKQISRLKSQLNQKQEQIQKLISVINMLKEKKQNQLAIAKSHKIVQYSTQTQQDYRDEQIKSLKQALIRHIRINKQLTKKLGVKNNENFNSINNSIQQMVSKITI